MCLLFNHGGGSKKNVEAREGFPRSNPLDIYNDIELKKRYRCMSKIDLLTEDFETRTRRNHAVPGTLQVFIALSFNRIGFYNPVKIHNRSVMCSKSDFLSLISPFWLQKCQTSDPQIGCKILCKM